MKIRYNADDYGLTLGTSQDILDLMRQGALDSISIIPNMECFDECMRMLIEAIPSLPFLPLMSVHLNLVEGRGIPKNFSWESLLAYSYCFNKRAAVYASVKKITRSQIRRGESAIRECINTAERYGVPYAQTGLRIDSHRYTHLLPIVWDGLTEVIREDDIRPEYIRCACEPLTPFLTAKEYLLSYRPVNLVKNLILKLYSKKADRYLADHGPARTYLLGILMSGKMDYDRLCRLIPLFAGKAKKDGRDLEIVFHPGRAHPDETRSFCRSAGSREFYISRQRSTEKNALVRLKGKE